MARREDYMSFSEDTRTARAELRACNKRIAMLETTIARMLSRLSQGVRESTDEGLPSWALEAVMLGEAALEGGE